MLDRVRCQIRPQSLYFFVAAVALVWMACSSSPTRDDDSTADNAEAQSAVYDVGLQNLRDHFSDDVGLFISVESVHAMLDILERSKESDTLPSSLHDQWEATASDKGRELDALLGFVPTDLSAWQQTGIDLHQSIMIGGTDDHVMSCLPVDHRERFDQFAADVIASLVYEGEPPHQTTATVGGNRFNAVGDQLAWFFLSDGVCVAVAEDRASVHAAEFLEGPGDGQQLVDTPSFQRFQASPLAADPLVAFATDYNLPTLPDRFLLQLFQPSDHSELPTASSITMSDDTFNLRHWYGFDDEILESAEEILHPEPIVDWSPFLLDDTRMAFRFAVSEFDASDSLWDRSPQWDRLISRSQLHLNRFAGNNLDIQQDIIEYIDGPIGGFIYDLDETVDEFTDLVDYDRLPYVRADVAGVMVVPFTEPQYVEQFFDELERTVSASSMTARRRPPAASSEFEDAEVLELTDINYRFIHSDGVLVVATDSVSDARVYQLLHGTSEEQPMGDGASGLGRPLQGSAFSGLYISDAEWLQRPLLPGISSTGGVEAPEKVRTQLSVGSTGINLDLHIYPGPVTIISELERYIRSAFIQAKAREAPGLLTRAADNATSYFNGKQRWCEPDGDEPWHPADRAGVEPGTIVEYDDKTFPGGPKIEVRTSSEIPEDGAARMPNPVVVGDVNIEAEVIFEQLGIPLDEPLYFRYTFQTGPAADERLQSIRDSGDGPGRGEDARAVLTAEANFDPERPDHHTTTHQLIIDSSDQPWAMPMWTEHQFQ